MLETILLANHDVSVLAAQKNLLTQNGYKVVGEAGNVEQTVEQFKELRPSLVIMDFHPVEFDCIKAIKEIQAIDNDMLIIISSNFCEHSEVVEAAILGVKDWVFTQLPLHSEMFMLAVKRVLGW